MTFRIGIELGLTGASQVKDGLKDIGGAAKDLADEFSKGLKNGMDQAVREMNRPMEELKAMANQAAKVLDIRPDWKIQEEIDKTRKAYDDLKASGLATSNELTRAKQAMKDKVGELRQEMGKWSGDWDELAKKLDNYGSKLQALGAKAMIAGAPAILAGKTSIETEHSLAGIANTSGIDPARAEQTVAAWKAKIAELSVFTNQKQTELVEAMGVMVSRGLDPEKAMAMLGPIGNAATATGGKISDIARTLYATYDNLKVPINESAKTLDVLATAGNRGAFELKDMAQYLPSLTAIAGSLKMVGIESTAQIAAAAQIAMKGAGDASQAATNLQNFLLKLSAPDTMKAFKDAGINLSAEIKKGLDSGDLIGHITGVVQQATNGDAEKISTLFRDAQVKQFLMPMLANIEEYKSIRDQALVAVGTIDKQKAVMEQTTDEKFKGIGNSFDAAIEKSSLFQGVLDKIKGTADWFAANPGVFEPIATVVTALAVGGAGLAAAGVALPAIATGITAIAAAGPALVAAAPAIATIVGVIAAWKVGDAVGTWMAGQIDELVKAVTGDKAATLGTALYDLIEGERGILTWPGRIVATAGEWYAAGGAMLDNLKAGIQAKVDGLIKGLGITAKLGEAVTIITGTVASWTKAGSDIIQGLIDGVTAKAQAVVDKIKKLGGDVVREFKELLGIKSPSKVFAVIGEQLGEGLEIGMIRKVDSIHEAGKKLGVSAIYGVKDQLSADWLKGQLRDYDHLQQDLGSDIKKAIEKAQADFAKWDDWERDHYERTMREVAKIQEPYIEARQKLAEQEMARIRALQDGVKADEEALAALKLKNDLLAQGESSQEAYNVAVIKAKLAAVDFTKSTWEEVDALEKRLAIAQETLGIAKQQDAVSGVTSLFKTLEDTAHQTFVSIFEGGKDTFTRLRDTLKNTLYDFLYQMTVKKWVVSIAASVNTTAASAAFGSAAAGGGAAAGGYTSAITSIGGMITGAGSFVTGMIGEAVGGISSMLGASTGVATGLGAFAMSAVPVLGAVAAIASLLGKKPSDKTAWGNIDLGTGDTGNVGGMTDKKAPSAETQQARDAMLDTAGQWADIIRALGGEVSGQLRLSTGERDGFRADFGADGTKEIVDTDLQRFFGRLFDAMTARATRLDQSMRTMLTTFDGTADEALAFGQTLVQIREYTRADLVGTAMEQIRQAGRTSYAIWQDASSQARVAAAAIDGSLGTAQALGAATKTMYQSELALVGQIQGMLASTSSMFGESIRSIDLSILDGAGKYDYLRAEIDAAYASLGAAVDPQAIGDLASQINRLTMEAYGLLDETQQRDVADEYRTYLEDVNRLTSDRLNASQAQVESQHAAMVIAIEAAMERVAARMEAAAAAQQAAASTPVRVDATVKVDVELTDSGAYASASQVGYA